MKKQIWVLLNLLVLASLMLIACGNGQTTSATPAPTNELAQTAEAARPTNSATPTDTAVPTELPDPGMEELKKIDPLFFDGGPVEFLGRWFDENSHDPEGTRHNTSAYMEMILVKHDGYITLLFVDDRMTVKFITGKYISWRWNPAEVEVDIDEATSEFVYMVREHENELKSIMPNGLQFYYANMNVSNISIYEELPFTVTTDHQSLEAPLGTYMPAAVRDEVVEGDVRSYQYGAIETFNCVGSNVRTIVFVTGGMTFPCNTENRESFPIYFGTKTLVQQTIVTEEQVRAMWKWMFSQMDTFSVDIGYSNVEFFWSGDYPYGSEIMPLSGFDALHRVNPTATPTATATLTRTPRPTLSPTSTVTQSSTPTQTGTP